MKPLKLLTKMILFTALIFILGFPNSTSVAQNLEDWSYEGASNPTQWGSLGQEFALCEVGMNQSPIDITHTVTGTLANIEFDYAPVPLVVVNNGRTVQVNYAAGSTVNLNGTRYELLQFHFHTPSEHHRLGKASAMELHLVHRNQAGQLGVVGVMIEAGAANSLVGEIWEHIPQVPGKNTVEDVKINAAELLPQDLTYFSYSGSLTTPPCREDVQWIILANGIQFSQAQIEQFQTLYQTNARPLQAANKRIIELHKTANVD